MVASVSLSLHTTPTPRLEERLFDEISLPSCNPSDEWGKKPLQEDDKSNEKEKKASGAKSWFSTPDHSSYLSSNSFAEYLSNIFPNQLTDGCTPTAGALTETRETESKTESRAERSNHSRCYIENTGSIRERRDDRERRGEGKEGVRDDNNGNNDTVSSVEEFTQISELTMDIHTVIAESKFVACSALPTIEEAKRFDPAGAACTADFSREDSRVRFGANGEHTKGGKTDVMGFVFDLVEDAFCVPLNRSKSERKIACLDAIHEETVKFTRSNSLVDKWQTSSSRSNRTPRRSGKGPSNISGSDIDNQLKESLYAFSPPTSKQRGETSFTIVDRPPPFEDVARRRTAAMDEEQTLDWSKIMSFAEKQLEADGKSVISKTDFVSVRTSQSDRLSLVKKTYTKTQVGPTTPGSTSAAPTPVQEQHEKSTSSSLSNSSSTHATAADSDGDNNGNEAVQEMRDVSVMDSISFEEEPRRLLLTSFLFRLLLKIIPGKGKGRQYERKSVKPSTPRVSEPFGPVEHANETMAHKMFRVIFFFLCFIFWPSGVPRKKVEYTPKVQKPEKPSLLKLVFEVDELPQRTEDVECKVTEPLS